MITTNLTGNFGNHISQYITTRCIAEKLGYDWGINPTPSHDYYNGNNQMDFMVIDFGNQNIQGIEYEYHETWINYYGTNICKFEHIIYNIKDNTILLGHNGAKGGVYQSESYFLDRREDIFKWMKIKPENKIEYDNILSDMNIILDNNLCVINFRGGEYKTINDLICRREYWRDSINHMLTINPNIKFICITDDPECAKYYMPFDIQCIHISIGFDYYCINQAKYIILSNSSFGLWAAWLNQNVNKIIAPKYWSQHNTSNGYWGIGDQYYYCFEYMNREGVLETYESVKQQAEEYYKLNNIY
jgi:hypothetical protein